MKNRGCFNRNEQIEVIFDENIKYKPDVFVTCEEAITRGQSFISPPKIIFEVVSKSTASHDYITKLQIYQRYGVLEYVIVEQTGEMIQYNLVDGVFKYLFDYGDEWRFNVEVFNIEETNVRLLNPELIESKGKPPNQYPNFDDEW